MTTMQKHPSEIKNKIIGRMMPQPTKACELYHGKRESVKPLSGAIEFLQSK